MTSLKGGCKELFSVLPSGRTRGNGQKGKYWSFCLNIQKHFITVRLTEPWHRLHREVVTICGDIQVLDNCLWVALLEQGV